MEKKPNISSESLQLLMTNDWPGNVRELRNALESAAVLAENKILPSNLPFSLKRNGDINGAPGSPDDPVGQTDGNAADAGLDQRIKTFERSMIVEALRRSGGVQVKAAAILGIKERSLWHRIKKHGINTADFKL